MTGFFTKKETQSITRPDGKVRSCHACGIYRDVLSPRMQPYGKFRKGILNIGEAPGETEDRRGKPWQGNAGTLLRETYKRLGIDLFEDCLNINAVSCRPLQSKGNRMPTNFEIECCRKNVLEVIKQYKPKMIVLFGNIPIQSLIGHRWKKDLGGVNKWRGWCIPDQDFNAWICPTFHPSFVMRSNAQELITVWEQDLERAFEMTDKEFPKYKEPNIQEITDLSILQTIPHGGFATFDYETTGLKPYVDGHKIVCASVAVNENEGYVFMMPEEEEQIKYFTDFLKNRHIKKGAHNMKFEELWSWKCLGVRVKGWEWDGMLAAHELDNRKGVTGLKFQTYINFGIVDYSSEVDKWMQGEDSKNANSMNKLLELVKTQKGKQLLLTYCGRDSVYEYRLAMKQMNIIQ